MPTLYQTALGPDYRHLPPLLQAFHDQPGPWWRGQVDVSWSPCPLLRSLLWLARLPAEGKQLAIAVRLVAQGQSESWQRYFGSRAMVSQQRQHPMGLSESFGPLRLLLRNQVDAYGLHQRSHHTRFLGLPLPAFLSLQVQAREWAVADRFHFDVTIGLGPHRLLHYCGWLQPETEPSPA
ncbi:hypothetical protein GCM10007907_27270 [Chitinimonas prasina]|uniref:DUF4166 domain-containing protein n=1 Tax=Chitinimonas prasina TaxID=1434937 RepID=A0ABQ5YG30_9NEIS|nr:DUF4166 domain-containing protein [Chitinimonas prasina]GLR13937.1 hypothetical protein GCM10007907_27270 [Chitinimonas prasina]